GDRRRGVGGSIERNGFGRTPEAAAWRFPQTGAITTNLAPGSGGGLRSGHPQAETMNRGAFVTGLGAVPAAPRGVESQQQQVAKVHRIGLPGSREAIVTD